MRFNDIIEARRNPDHPAQKSTRISTIDTLRKYSNRDDIYVSFTQLPKIGINPSSRYSTPLGIYCYPIKEYRSKIYDYNRPYQVFPFAANAPFIFILKETRPLQEISLYTQSDFDRDKENIKKITGISDEDIEVFKNIKVGLESTVADKPIGDLWSLTYNLTKNLSKPAVKWSAILRKLGYNGFSDKTGTKTIHPAEPIQAFFLTHNSYEVVEKLSNDKGKLNKVYYDKMRQLPDDKKRHIKQINRFIRDRDIRLLLKFLDITYIDDSSYIKNIKIPDDFMIEAYKKRRFEVHKYFGVTSQKVLDYLVNQIDPYEEWKKYRKTLNAPPMHISSLTAEQQKYLLEMNPLYNIWINTNTGWLAFDSNRKEYADRFYKALADNTDHPQPIELYSKSYKRYIPEYAFENEDFTILLDIYGGKDVFPKNMITNYITNNDNIIKNAEYVLELLTHSPKIDDNLYIEVFNKVLDEGEFTINKIYNLDFSISSEGEDRFKIVKKIIEDRMGEFKEDHQDRLKQFIKDKGYIYED